MTKIALIIILAGLAPLRESYAATPKEDYELQERCGKRTDELFKREYGTSGVINTKDGQALVGYRNHYNKKLNKCFFLLTYSDLPYKNKKTAASTQISLYDISENREYGSYFIRVVDKLPIHCKVLDKLCRSEQEWNSLVNPYMEE